MSTALYDAAEKSVALGGGPSDDRPIREADGRFRMIDLFCGAGGLTLGFTEEFGHTRFRPVWANDYDEDAVATYRANFGPRYGAHCVYGDIVDILKEESVEIPRADVVIGGPPCQGFSLLNKGRADDPRKQMWIPFMEVVERSGADVFVIENVPQILGSEEHRKILRRAKKIDRRFRFAAGKLCAADYGTPQVRWRAFIIGSRVSAPKKVFPPRPTHRSPDADNAADPSLPLWRTLRDEIADLPPPFGTEIRDDPPPLDLHFGRNPTAVSMARYRAVSEEGMNRFDLQRIAPELTPGCWIRKTSGGTDLFGRLWWDRPSVTIRTEFFKPEKGRYLHPTQHRPITHREAARIQSFPDDFRFVGSKVEIAKQIGNAVPPRLAAAVAECVLKLLSVRQV